MKCNKCGSEWTSSVQIGKCPFCGSNLNEESTAFESVSEALQYLIKYKHIDILLDTEKVISFIADKEIKNDREKRLFLIGCKFGITEKMYGVFSQHDRGHQREIIQNIKTFLLDDAFISENNAVELINFFFFFLLIS